MGLDSYLYASADKPSLDVDFLESSELELYYWRKNYDLNSEMEGLCQKREGTIDNGGLIVILTAEDLEKIKVYFEGPEGLAAFEKAKEAFEKGLYVYYSSSW